MIPDRPTAPEPAAEHSPESLDQVAILDGRDALAFVVIRPHPGNPDGVRVDAGSPYMEKGAVAFVLRQVADRMDEAARAEGRETIPYPAPTAPAGD